ncbi:MAG: hypothetical protein KGL39_20815 [Patescibacteria group bacterium]|nr:hypothetical protein [Patescibacteria group bacterium]
MSTPEIRLQHELWLTGWLLVGDEETTIHPTRGRTWDTGVMVDLGPFNGKRVEIIVRELPEEE